MSRQLSVIQGINHPHLCHLSPLGSSTSMLIQKNFRAFFLDACLLWTKIFYVKVEGAVGWLGWTPQAGCHLGYSWIIQPWHCEKKSVHLLPWVIATQRNFSQSLPSCLRLFSLVRWSLEVKQNNKFIWNVRWLESFKFCCPTHVIQIIQMIQIIRAPGGPDSSLLENFFLTPLGPIIHSWHGTQCPSMSPKPLELDDSRSPYNPNGSIWLKRLEWIRSLEPCLGILVCPPDPKKTHAWPRGAFDSTLGLWFPPCAWPHKIFDVYTLVRRSSMSTIIHLLSSNHSNAILLCHPWSTFGHPFAMMDPRNPLGDHPLGVSLASLSSTDRDFFSSLSLLNRIFFFRNSKLELEQKKFSASSKNFHESRGGRSLDKKILVWRREVELDEPIGVRLSWAIQVLKFSTSMVRNGKVRWKFARPLRHPLMKRDYQSTFGTVAHLSHPTVKFCARCKKGSKLCNDSLT